MPSTPARQFFAHSVLRSRFDHIVFSYFYTGKPTHYDALDSMLRMSTKYLAQKLRSDLIKHLIMIYPPGDGEGPDAPTSD